VDVPRKTRPEKRRRKEPGEQLGRKKREMQRSKREWRNKAGRITQERSQEASSDAVIVVTIVCVCVATTSKVVSLFDNMYRFTFL